MPQITYLDFDILIKRDADGFCAQLIKSPVGRAVSTFQLPFTDGEIENFLLRIGHKRRSVRGLDSSNVAKAESFGRTLFDAVFKDELLSCFRRSLDDASRQNSGLRIRLRLTDVPELADLPWEYLYCPSAADFLGLSIDTPVVRDLDLPEKSDPPLAVTQPLRILVMISLPEGEEELEVEREWRNLNEALADLLRQKSVILDRLERPTLPRLQRQLRLHDYHIFHFIGHGGFEQDGQNGVLIFEDDDLASQPRKVNGQELGRVFRDHKSIRLIILNACEGARNSRSDPFAGMAQSLIRRLVPAVIAMQFEITDKAAITFAHEFYRALAECYPVDAALAEARKIMAATPNSVEWATPVLYMRSPNGRIFDVQPAPSTSPLKEAPVEKEVSVRIESISSTDSLSPEKLARLEEPAGIMDPESPFYIERPNEKSIIEIISRKGRKGMTVAIKAPGQMGKSTLLHRLVNVTKEGKQVCYFDFQQFGTEALNNGEIFFRQFCAFLTNQLEMDEQLERYDKLRRGLGNSGGCTTFVERHVLREINRPLLMAFDETDAFFDSNFRSDFFMMVRSWHGKRAISANWKEVDIIFVTSAELSQLIDDGSPFNVGDPVVLSDFNEQEVKKLNLLCGSPLDTKHEKELINLLGGHPYLVRRALYVVASKQLEAAALFSSALSERGPFGNHLGSLFSRIYGRRNLVEGLREVLINNACSDEGVTLRLINLGIVYREGRKVIPRCALYQNYFKERLNVQR